MELKDTKAEDAGRSAEDISLDVRIRSVNELQTAAGVLVEDVYFEGGDVLRCYEGCFRFKLDGRDPIELNAGESLVTYPDQRVTIEALENRNQLLYAIFDGSDVSDYFDRIGFFDGIHGPTSTQRIVFEAIRSRQETSEGRARTDLMTLMNDALITYAHDFREHGNALLMDAMRQIKINLHSGAVRLTELCTALRVSRSHLHRSFAAKGMGSVSENVKREQLRLALRLLRETRLTVTEIAAKAGFLTATHFATFVKRHTGKSPRDLRR